MNNRPLSGFDKLRANIETGFARWGLFCSDRPWWIIATTALVLAFFSSFLPTLQVDTSNESYLHEDDPARVVFDQFQKDFGKDEKIILLIESDGDIVNDPFLRKLESLHRALEEVRQVDKVDSLINARLTLGRDDELIVKDLMEDWPQSEAEFSALRERILANPLYRNRFIGDSLERTVVIITPDTYTASYSEVDSEAELADFDFESGFDDLAVEGDATATAEAGGSGEATFITDEEIYGVIDAIEALKPQFESGGFRMSMTGSPFFMHQMFFVMARDMFLFSAVGVVIISILLFAVFRRWVMVVLPVAVSMLSVTLTFSLIAFSGKVATTSVQILPSLLMAVGVGNSVHICTVFFQALDRGESSRDALRYALGHSGLAVLMTGLTTAGAMVSFVTANMKPVADIGIVAPLGILNALVFSLVLLPALLAVTPFRARPGQGEAGGSFQRFLAWCTEVSTSHPGKVALVWFAVLGVCLVQVAALEPSHNPIKWFPPGMEARDATDAMDRHFGGGTNTEIIIDTGKRNGLHDPELLHAVDRAVNFALQFEQGGIQAGSSISLLDINKELHQALNGNDPAFYKIPDSEQLIAQELLLFENSGSRDLQGIVDTSFSKMRITLMMPFVDGFRYGEYLPNLRAGFTERIDGLAEVTFTGVISFLASTVSTLIGDTIMAYGLAFMIIAPLMMLLVGSVRIGLLSMVPNITPIIITLALMRTLDIPLDAFTVLVGSIALGLAVDDTIHFMHNYRRYLAQSGDVRYAVGETLRTTGKALLVTSLVLASSFFSNLLGSMYNIQHFGMLTGFCIIVAFLADVLLAPALMALLARWKARA